MTTERTSFDVVVIGSGAGGGPIAHDLARIGKSVLVLDKGPLLRPQYQTPDELSDFKRDEMFATGPERIVSLPGVANRGASFFTSHAEPDLNDEPHIYRERDGTDRVTIEGYTAQVVGGGTQLYGGVSVRYTATDFRLRSFNEGRTDIREDPNGDSRRESRDWPISYDDLEPWYGRAEELLGINGTVENQAKRFSADHYQPPLPPTAISRFIEIGMDALRMPRYRTPVAEITRDHPLSGRKASDPRTGFVNRYGDPLGLKSSTWIALLSPVSEMPNFEIRPNSVVTHLEAEGATVTRVHYRDPAGAPRVVTGKAVVVACSAIESVRLLKLSAEMDAAFDRRINASGLLGRYFLTHSFGGASGIMPGRYDKSISLDSDWATDFCWTEDFIRSNGIWSGGLIYNNTSDSALPLSLARTYGSEDLDNFWRVFNEDARLLGDRAIDFLDYNIGRRLSISFMANQVPVRDNRIELHPTVRDKWGRRVAYIVKDWHQHDRYVMDVLAEQCARIIRFGGDGGKGEFREEGKGGVYAAVNAAARVANHVLGGVRFGTDRNDSVLDPSCRAWEFDNLYVTDGAFMPTSGGGNPTLTIEANSFRVADILKGRV